MLEDTNSGTSIPTERRRIAWIRVQDPRLFPHLTVSRNLRYGLARAGAGGRIVEFDQVAALLGLETLLRRRPHHLSGGERQRVSLGRALLSQPQLLLLDEPLSSLDAARREEVLPYLERLRDNLSIPMVLVTHQFDEVLRLATHVVVMDAGAGVLAQGVTGRGEPTSSAQIDCWTGFRRCGAGWCRDRGLCPARDGGAASGRWHAQRQRP